MTPDRLLSAIRAALDEDERLARATIHPGHTGRWEFHHDAGDRFGDPLDPPNWWIELDRIGPPLTDNTGLGPDTMRHIARHDPAAVLRRVAADREIVDDWAQPMQRRAELLARPDAELHADRMHPDYEYATTEGPRKAWLYSDEPPEGEGWERNVDAGYPGEGWERFDYTEESYWRRRLPEGERSAAPAPPRHIWLLARGLGIDPEETDG